MREFLGFILLLLIALVIAALFVKLRHSVPEYATLWLVR